MGQSLMASWPLHAASILVLHQMLCGTALVIVSGYHTDALQGPQLHSHDTISLPLLGTYEKMTVAASLVGAVAGGAAAGPLGVSLGALHGSKSL